MKGSRLPGKQSNKNYTLSFGSLLLRKNPILYTFSGYSLGRYREGRSSIIGEVSQIHKLVKLQETWPEHRSGLSFPLLGIPSTPQVTEYTAYYRTQSKYPQFNPIRLS